MASIPPTTILTLPNEIICMTGEYLVPHDLSAFARTAKRFNVILARLLLRKILLYSAHGPIETVLNWAIQNNHVELAKKLLSVGKDLLLRSQFSLALANAAVLGRLDIILFILDIILDNRGHVLNPSEAIHAIISDEVSDFSEVHKALVDAEVTYYWPAGFPTWCGSFARAAKAAAGRGDIGFLQFLSDIGPSLKMEELWKHDLRPLFYAAHYGQTAVVEYLLESGADQACSRKSRLEFRTALLSIAGDIESFNPWDSRNYPKERMFFRLIIRESLNFSSVVGCILTKRFLWS